MVLIFDVVEVIHGDIKPENVLVYRNDAGHYSARVIDFGYSVSYRTTRVANLCSTIGWTAPEWHHRGIVFQEARKMDIYSAGLVCLWLLCFVDEAQVPSNVRNDPSKFLETSSRISLPVDLQLFFTSCLSPDPDDRSIRMEVLMQKSLNLTSFPEVQHLVASPEQEALDEEFSLATSIGQLCSGDYRLRIMLVKMLSTAANDLSLFTKLRNNARFQLALCLALGFGTPKDLHASRSSLADSTFNEKIFAAEIDSIKLSNHGYKSRKIKELDTEGFLGDLQFQDYYRQIGLLPRAELECNREAADMASVLGVDHHLVKSLRRMNTTSCSKEVKFLQLP
jgi:serine/threonine protein kinase